MQQFYDVGNSKALLHVAAVWEILYTRMESFMDGTKKNGNYVGNSTWSRFSFIFPQASGAPVVRPPERPPPPLPLLLLPLLLLLHGCGHHPDVPGGRPVAPRRRRRLRTTAQGLPGLQVSAVRTPPAAAAATVTTAAAAAVVIADNTENNNNSSSSSK